MQSGGREPGLVAEIVEELVAVPALLRGDLGQEYRGVPSLGHINAVLADLYFLDASDDAHRGEHRDLDGNAAQLIFLNGRKARIFESGGYGHIADGAYEAFRRAHAADASA